LTIRAVEVGSQPLDLVGQLGDLGKVREVGQVELQPGVLGVAPNVCKRALAPTRIAPVHQHGGAAVGEVRSHAAPEAIGSPGHEDRHVFDGSHPTCIGAAALQPGCNPRAGSTNLTPAQVVLRWHVQPGTVPIEEF
jgi:hypothetical protein